MIQKWKWDDIVHRTIIFVYVFLKNNLENRKDYDHY